MITCHRCGLPYQTPGRVEGQYIVHDGQCRCWNSYPYREHAPGVSMQVGEEVEVNKRGDPNDGRAGTVAALPEPQRIDVAFEDGSERASYRPEELRRVKPIIPRGMQNQVRGRFWNLP